MDQVVLSFCSLSLLVLAGKYLRVRIKFLQRLYLPSCVIGGMLGLAAVQSVILLRGTELAEIGGLFGRLVEQVTRVGLLETCTAGWSKLPGILINVVFAALFLGVTIPPLRTLWRHAGPQLAYGQIVAWGQYVVGLGLVLVLLRPLFGTSPLFGVIVPVGFEGGHGTAGGLAPMFTELGWAEGGDYALASATAGIISAIVVGMALVNWAARKGHVSNLRPISTLSEEESAGIYPLDKRPSAGNQTVSPDSVDSLALHLAIIGIAILIGFLIKKALVGIETHLPGVGDREIMRAFPLFPLCMIGGLIVQLAVSKWSRITPIDHSLMQRLAGTALDFLVVAAISMIRLEVIAEGLLPFLVIVAGGILWNVFCVMWLARRLLPNAWFERAIAEMGQSMGVTATGLLLLRVVDPEGKTEAPSAFGYKQLLHEPFMGGGLWTTFAVFLVYSKGGGFVFVVSVAAIIAWLTVWFIFLRPARKT